MNETPKWKPAMTPEKMSWKPCPFCGGTSLSIETYGFHVRAVMCWDCGARGGGSQDDKEAVRKWNMRRK